MESNSNMRIIDIARIAGVSIGTVDRVLHNRGHVSEEKRERIEKVLKEINYEPNLVARVLASKKTYTFAALVPSYPQGSYWDLVCQGINKAFEELKKFNVQIEYIFFDQHDRNSFCSVKEKLLDQSFDGVVIATLFQEYVEELSKRLDDKNVPYIYIDSDIPNQNDLAYFGGDSFASGQIAAKLLTQQIGMDADIFFAHIRFRYKEISLQMKTREMGFMDYLSKNKYKGKIHHIELNPDNQEISITALREFLAKNKTVKGGIVLNSRIYEFIELLDQIEDSLKENIRLIGHDTIEQSIAAQIGRAHV